MKIHFLSRSPWNEPHRLRQQLAQLLAGRYLIDYHVARLNDTASDACDNSNINCDSFRLIERFSSVPLVTFLNSLIIYFFLRGRVKNGDVLVNFMPELIFYPAGVKVVGVINDDLSSMIKPIFRPWFSFLLRLMAKRSLKTFFVSQRLAQKYPSKNSFLLYPWSDRKYAPVVQEERNIFLYWGYISEILDFDAIRRLAEDLNDNMEDGVIYLVGPVVPGVQNRLDQLLIEYPCIKYLSPRSLEVLPLNNVIFGIEFIDSSHPNAAFVEVPNKAPRLLSYGIPLLYSGVDLLDLPFFFRYEYSILKVREKLDACGETIQGEICDYLASYNSDFILNNFSSFLGNADYGQ